MTHFYETPGNRGIASKTVFMFVCGGCFQNLEIAAANIDDAKEEARTVAGWRNHFPRRLGGLLGAQAAETTWRCERCVEIKDNPSARFRDTTQDYIDTSWPSAWGGR